MLVNRRVGAADLADIDAARLVLERMGVTPEQVLRSTGSTPELPTFRDYIPRVAAVVSEGTKRAYSSYWNQIIAVWGDRRLDEPTSLEITLLADSAKARARTRRNSRGGRFAAEHLVAAMRCIYRYAVDEEMISDKRNPAVKVAKPRRQPSTRHALPSGRLAEINQVAATTGDDPALDVLILRLHTETACRRGGALALRPRDLDRSQCVIFLREKGQIARWQPISPTLMAALVAHDDDRGNGSEDDLLLRYQNGRPLTTRRYDYLWNRVGQHLSWVAVQGISAHWLRHTTLTWVERRFGYAVARAYAGHHGTSDREATPTYIRANIEDVAIALATLTGEDHPLGRIQPLPGIHAEAKPEPTATDPLLLAQTLIR